VETLDPTQGFKSTSSSNTFVEFRIRA